MVTINLWHLIAICVVATLANGLVGYATGLKIGYLRGRIAGLKTAASDYDAAIAAQRKEGE